MQWSDKIKLYQQVKDGVFIQKVHIKTIKVQIMDILPALKLLILSHNHRSSNRTQPGTV